MLADIALLWRAWRHVRANRGGPGGDGVGMAEFAPNAAACLERLAAELAAGTYRPGRLRRVPVDKPGGRTRWLAVPCIVDRVAQTAALALLVPALDRRMSDASFAFRPRLGVAHALEEVRRARADGHGWVAETDIAACFDSIPHRRLLDELAIWIEDPAWLRVIALWLGATPWRRRGIPQGAPVSPLLCNLYLHPFDRAMEAAGHRAIRYADDLVICARSRERAARGLDYARVLLAARGLRMKPEKTRLIAPTEPLGFLGQTVAPVMRAAAIDLRKSATG